MAFSGYRRDLYADPDLFTLQVGMLMEGLSEEVVRYCTDPNTGIQAEYPHFPPNSGEVRLFIAVAKKRVEGFQLIAAREAAGYRWVDEPAENRVGFYNAQGVEWHKRDTLRVLAPPRQLTIEEQGQRDRAIAVALQRMDAPKFKGELMPDDGRHYDRIAADLAARKARNDLLAAEQKPPEQEQETTP